ncbi:MAG: hypothetical protein U0Z75_02455 [Deinococcaceae bacterium]
MISSGQFEDQKRLYLRQASFALLEPPWAIAWILSATWKAEPSWEWLLGYIPTLGVTAVLWHTRKQHIHSVSGRFASLGSFWNIRLIAALISGLVLLYVQRGPHELSLLAPAAGGLVVCVTWISWALLAAEVSGAVRDFSDSPK